MISQIVRKEILENFLSLRFVLSLLLVILIFAVSGFVFISKHEQQLQDYSKDTNRSLANLRDQTSRLYRLAINKQEVYRKPKVLALCAEGFEKSIPNHFRFNAFSGDYPQIRGRTNALLFRFCDVDWVFIISLFLSFGALIFAYNSICGEKEAGTLRLMLAGSIPRHKVLLGKYLALMFTLGVPMLLGILINLIIVTSSENISIDAGQWYKILVIIILSFLYLSIFVLLGMFISSRTSRSASSMVILLFLWVGLVILIPSFGRIVSKTFQKVPTQAEMQRRLSELMEQMFQDMLSGKYGENAGSAAPLESGICNPPARARFYNAGIEERNKIMDEHLNQMTAQVVIGRRFIRISPAEIYRQACEAIAGTGIGRFSELRRQINQYQADLKDYVRSKDTEDPNSLHLLYDEMFTASLWKTMSHKPVDFDTVPKFQERDLALGQSLQWAIWDIGLLAVFNLVFFAAAFVSFLRYDVR
ncbi:MAG TPA: ABC transporter permease subunit [Sedimentisphaerales bacterium]|nr:ABC transporter permease subunit [Sedimentisphaerales bacterium]